MKFRYTNQPVATLQVHTLDKCTGILIQNALQILHTALRKQTPKKFQRKSTIFREANHDTSKQIYVKLCNHIIKLHLDFLYKIDCRHFQITITSIECQCMTNKINCIFFKTVFSE